MRLRTNTDSFIVDYTEADARRFVDMNGGRINGRGSFEFLRHNASVGSLWAVGGTAAAARGDDWNDFMQECSSFAQYKASKAAGRAPAVAAQTYLARTLEEQGEGRSAAKKRAKRPAAKKAAPKRAKRPAAKKPARKAAKKPAKKAAARPKARSHARSGAARPKARASRPAARARH